MGLLTRAMPVKAPVPKFSVTKRLLSRVCWGDTEVLGLVLGLVVSDHESVTTNSLKWNLVTEAGGQEM